MAIKQIIPWFHFLQLKIEAHVLFVYVKCVCVCVHATILLLCSWIQLLQTHAKQWIVLDLLWHDYETIICTDEYILVEVEDCARVLQKRAFMLLCIHQNEMNSMINLRKWKRIASIVKSNVCHFKCFYDTKVLRLIHQRHRWI